MPREPAYEDKRGYLRLGAVLSMATVSRSRRRDGGDGAKDASRSAVGVE